MWFGLVRWFVRSFSLLRAQNGLDTVLHIQRLHLFGQDPHLADMAGEFSFRLLPGLFPYYLFKILTKYLQTQNRLAPGVWIGVLANGMNALFNWALIFEAGWGIAGAPWATTLTRAAEFVMIIGYVQFQKKNLRETWPRFDKENLSFDVLRPFWKLAISGALSITAEAVRCSCILLTAC